MPGNCPVCEVQQESNQDQPAGIMVFPARQRTGRSAWPQLPWQAAGQRATFPEQQDKAYELERKAGIPTHHHAVTTSPSSTRLFFGKAPFSRAQRKKEAFFFTDSKLCASFCILYTQLKHILKTMIERAGRSNPERSCHLLYLNKTSYYFITTTKGTF